MSIVLLACDCDTARAVFHALTREFGAVDVIVEDRVPRGQLLERRVRRLGWVAAAGQAAFAALAVPLLARWGRSRVSDIVNEHALDLSPLPPTAIRVSSVNDAEARAALQRARPAVVVVNGTRIIGRETLRAVDAPFLNIHLGITPLYRGSHGGYWALAEGRADLVGATVHVVDEGIDTGDIVEQRTTAVTSRDSLATYPLLQLGTILPALIESVRTVLAGQPIARRRRDDLPSRLRHHPTLWAYLAGRWRRGVK